MKLSAKSIECLTGIVTGDSQITSYRTGPQLVKLFNGIGFDDTYGAGFPSRNSYVADNLLKINDLDKMKEFFAVIFNPADFIENPEILDKALGLMNKYLEYDDYKLSIKNKKCDAIAIKEADVVIGPKKMITREYANEMLIKCTERMNNKDYSGAITAARSLLEDVIARDIFVQITGKEMQTKGKLTADYHKLSPLLNLSLHEQSNEALKQLAVSLVGAIESIALIRNKMSDSHSREIKPDKRHAQFVVNAAKTLVNFLYDTLEYSQSMKDEIYETWNRLPYVRYGNGECHYGRKYNFKNREELLADLEYKNFCLKCDPFLKRFLIDKLIQEFTINSFNDSDKFCIAMVILLDALNKEDISKIHEKECDNRQMALTEFLDDLSNVKPELVPENLLQKTAQAV